MTDVSWDIVAYMQLYPAVYSDFKQWYNSEERDLPFDAFKVISLDDSFLTYLSYVLTMFDLDRAIQNEDQIIQFLKDKIKKAGEDGPATLRLKKLMK